MMVYGPGSLAECYWRCLEVAPVMEGIARDIEPIGRVVSLEGVRWIGMEGPEGAAILFVITDECDLEQVTEHLNLPLSRVRTPWKWDYAAKGARVPEDAFSLLANAQAVAKHDIPGYGVTRPPMGAEPELPETLREELVAQGWEPRPKSPTSIAHLLPETMAYPVPNPPTAVILNPLWGGGMTLTVRVAELQNGRVPQWLFEQDLGACTTAVTDQVVLLADTFPSPADSDSAAEKITRRAADLAVFAFQMSSPE